MSNEYDETGTRRKWWDDDNRLVYEYDASGKQVGEPRPYTPDENAAADAATAEKVAYVNEQTIRDRARQALTANLAAITQLEQFAGGSASLTNNQRDNYLRQLAQYQARAFKELNALIRLELRDLATSDDT